MTQKRYLFIPLIFLLCLVCYTSWQYLNKQSITTEDAYVSGNIIPVTSQVNGTILNIEADNSDFIEAGEPLVLINQIDAKLALQKAQANLATTLRSVEDRYAQIATLEASIEEKKSNLQKAQNDYQRRVELIQNNLISKELLDEANNKLQASQAALKMAQSDLQAALTYTANTTPKNHPAVQTAKAELQQAWLDWNRTTIKAPASGYIAKRSAQVGQRISAGTTTMSIVPLDNVWVTANFKETQINTIQQGQKVVLTSDVYGDDIVYHGIVQGIEPGTGSAFALLPAQNATGNWIKVVQRVPVRILLDQEELKQHPLRPGLSMAATVTQEKVSEQELNALVNKNQKWSTSVFKDETAVLNNMIDQIVATNL